MHVFITGGSGLTGPAVVSELLSAGHRVTGLARSAASADRLASLGAEPFAGSLDDLDRLRAGAAAADGVIHMAAGGEPGDWAGIIKRDVDAIEALGTVLADTGKPFVSTSGTMVMTPGRLSEETDPPDENSPAKYRIPGERSCLRFADRGVRSSVIRLAPTVHGPGDYGFVAMLIAVARKTGVSAYIGDGANRWPAVHRLDAATLFRLALEKAPAGTALHGAAESGVPLRDIAEKIGRTLDLPVVSVGLDEAPSHFGSAALSSVFAADVPVSSARTRELLGWNPRHHTLIEDLEHGDYFTVAEAR
ncbi:SDR family oxidoreductase [Mycobacterium palustre]|uniref:3-beta hydroxysteroid dehydrogenase n=1 Tax=Mycobacterium palustre TaxID=153971 RepID=A0A1X1ZWJ8_9MYCO|nr:SDR family oxidoreductase [Mycobacterium palustre]MCV7100509.1 SDR family oxidoreductase [Mycobacterium palustre]ORW28566.1 3-beta hydroxysteroid dehydrogenase [Mycobacterium palustre]